MTGNLKQKQIKSAVAFLAGGIGVLTIALLNLAQDLIGGVHGPVGQGLIFNTGVGPYSRKESFSVLVWLISWSILNRVLVSKNVDETNIMRLTCIFYILATILVFPPFLDLF